MPELVRLYMRQVAVGFALGLAFTVLLVAFDVAGLRHLMTAVSGGWLAALMLGLFNSLVFAGVQFGIVVMLMAERPGGPARGRRIRIGGPVRVEAGAPPRH